MTRIQRWMAATGIILALPACASTQSLPETVLVPIPAPCEIEQVTPSGLPVAEPGANVARKAQVAAARIMILLADRERLIAANTNPCPKELPDGPTYYPSDLP